MTEAPIRRIDEIGDESRRRILARSGQQIVGVGVVVGRNLKCNALVQTVGGHLVQVGPRHFQDRQSGISRAGYRFGQPLVGLGGPRVEVGRPRAPAMRYGEAFNLHCAQVRDAMDLEAA